MIEAGRQYDLPAGHGYLQPAMTVTAVAVKLNEWVYYEGNGVKGSSTYDHFSRDAKLHVH